MFLGEAGSSFYTMPFLCCGSSSVQVDKLESRPSDKAEDLDDENNNESKNQDGDRTVETEDQEYSQSTPGRSSGLLKSSPRKMTYEVNPDPEAAPEPESGATKKGKKSPKKKKVTPTANGSVEGEHLDETAREKTSPTKKKTGKKSSFRDTEEMEMSPLDPRFYDSQTMQPSTGQSQLYSQHTYEDEEDGEFVENLEEERKRNKQRQRMRRKQEGQKDPEPAVDSAQAAYERAQKEIDKVLGPREVHAVPDAITGNEKKRSKRRSKKGQVNEGFTEDDGSSRRAAAGDAQETLEEVKSRVHALLDDAFSLISNSYSSIGNKVAPASPDKKEKRPQSAEGERRGSNAQPSSSQTAGGMPEVEEVRGPKPGEKLHTPVYVDRTHSDYDPTGLITWSPYRAADDSARIVLPESQPPSTKAATQERVHTTTFMGTAVSGTQDSSFYATQPAQPIVIRTQQQPNMAGHQGQGDIEGGRQGDRTAPQSGETQTASGKGLTSSAFSTMNSSHIYGVTADAGTSYIPYPGLETYESVPEDATATSTTTAHFTASPIVPQEPAFDVLPERRSTANGDVGDTVDAADTPVENHRPPTKNVGSKDEKDVVVECLKPGTSPKELVDSIRQELRSMSGKLAATSPAENDPQVRTDSKPRKKPRKSSYIDV